MEANAHIITALERLEAAMAAPESKEWLASRKEIGRQIDPEAVDVTWQFKPVLDPYELCNYLPDQLQLAGREYFARSLDTEDWISFDDLPKPSRDRLWRRISVGHFDTNDVNLTQAADKIGVNFNRMLFIGGVEGRVAVRFSRRSGISLIVKPADPEDMIYQMVTLGLSQRTAILNGWISARTAKRLFPLIRVGGIAAHFVQQRELRPVHELKTILTAIRATSDARSKTRHEAFGDRDELRYTRFKPQ